MGHFGTPGINGSLGMCAVCGETFLLEILTGENIKSFNVDGISRTLYSHKKCLKTLTECSDENWRNLPDASPLKHAFLKANAEAA